MIVLHLVQDEKFIDFFARTMNILGEIEHRYIVHKPSLDKPLQHIKQLIPFRMVDDGYFPSRLMEKDLCNCDVLVVHFLTAQAVEMIASAPTRVRIVWSGWGADYYYLLPKGGDLLEPETRSLVRTLNRQEAGINPLLHARLLLRPLRRFYTRHTQLIPAIRRIHLFSSPIPEDYALLKKSLKENFIAEYIQINYGSVEDTFSVGGESVGKNNILVGNSAHPTNNHIEAFRLLASHDLSDRKVIVPLSYGDINYRDNIVEIGNKILGDAFAPIVNYLPLSDYNRVISSCSFAIMNHRRQQALGNIGSLLYRGAKVFLNNKNVCKQFFDTRGAHVHDISELKGEKNDIFDGLTTEKKNKNVEVIDDFWGKSRISTNSLEFLAKLPKPTD
jgi:hypothetical protein